jgi:hypothetical protein
VDFSGFQRTNVEVEERRLMPAYVEDLFLKACRTVGVKVEPRADGLWRIDHVPADLRSDRLAAVRRLGKPEAEYRKITLRKEHLDLDQHVDVVLIGPGHPLYAAVDERLNELLSGSAGAVGAYLDAASDAPYYLHFFEMTIRGQNTKGEPQTLYGELVAVKENLGPHGAERFEVVPADSLLDLPAYPSPADHLDPLDVAPAADFLKGGHQTERRLSCQAERKQIVEVCREYLAKSFRARIHASQDRVMSLRAREAGSPEMAIARQRAENELADLQRAEKERSEGLKRLALARHGPVRHVASALVLPPKEIANVAEYLDELDPEVRRRSELAAEDLVVQYETARGWECERVGHLKLGFDVRSLGPAHPQTGYRDPVHGVRRIEVKGRKRGQPIRLTTNEWYKAQQLGDSYWLYVVWDPLGKSDLVPLCIRNPAKQLDHAKREVVAARYFDIPADALESAAKVQRE